MADAESYVRAQVTKVRGVVQGVGFRPFVFRIASKRGVAGWVLNDSSGVSIHAEGTAAALATFTKELRDLAPTAARIDSIDTEATTPAGFHDFRIAGSVDSEVTSAGISPDLPVCDDCIAELFDKADRRADYPYINCTACGPRYSIMHGLPYDRRNTTMALWEMCASCASDYGDPFNRRFHAQPVACPECGPQYRLHDGSSPQLVGTAAIHAAADLLNDGKIVAVKGIGGYHLACDASRSDTVAALRNRKFRKERPFALMLRDLESVRRTVELSPACEALLTSSARPIVLARALIALAGVAPGMSEFGVMLPYTPLHLLLFAHGAPERLVMTSANRSSEPIAYRDDDAIQQLAGIADAFLVGERPIARRVDDSVVKIGTAGPMLLRRSRGYAPGSVARIPTVRPVLALGADLKNAITLVVNGDAIMSQHVGDLENYAALEAFRETVSDLSAMYDVNPDELRVVHDLHPEYSSTVYAMESVCAERLAVQHHRAHVASVLAERGAFEERVIGVAFDGTGYGDDGAIWGGEFFSGSVMEGFVRVGHLRSLRLPGGDAAARYPVQSAAGFLADATFGAIPDLTNTPYHFPDRYRQARDLVMRDVRCFPTTSAGRLFDAVAAILGFTREVTYEGQAAVWLEQLAISSGPEAAYPFPFSEHELDFRPMLMEVIEARKRGHSPSDTARAFHRGLARGIADAIVELADEFSASTAVLSGGVFQNNVLLADVLDCLSCTSIRVWTNRDVPSNDGGISLGQAALTLRA